MLLFFPTKRETHMRGVVIHVEHRIGWIAIRDHHDEITIAEILGGYNVERDHVIIGNLHSLGVCFNQTTNKSMHVMVEYIRLTARQSIAAIQRRRR
ncbi:hypothetical protein D3C87_1221760 [compost metagenome]